MMTKNYQLAGELVALSGLQWCDVVRIILELYEYVPGEVQRQAAPCMACMREIIRMGAEARQMREETRPFLEVMERSIAARACRREATRRDLAYLARRLMRIHPSLAERPLRAMGTRECRELLHEAFTTPSQFKKGRAFLSSVFSYGERHEWCSENPVRRIRVPVLREKEICPLQSEEIESLLKVVKEPPYRCMAPMLGLMLWAGVRPHEVRRLEGRDIDLKRRFIYLKPRHSKTGGGRQIPIRPVLLAWLKRYGMPDDAACGGWVRRWRSLRRAAGFVNWTQDVLRHTFASYHARRFENLPMLQLEMGHRSVDLLRTRYVNVLSATDDECVRFFGEDG